MNAEKKHSLEKTYERILNVGFCIIPYEDLSDIISADPMIYGTAKDERILSFEGVEALFKSQYEQIGNMKPSFNRSRIAFQVSNGENNACIVEEITLKFSSDEENHSIFMRATCMMEYLDNKWKLTHWHTSTPVDTENDPWHLEEWKREKEKLQQLVDQQTATLKQNNRELQIEAALERVRSRSMAMTKSEQLSDVILEIHHKFKELDISMESRIAIVVVFDSDGKDFNQYIASNDVGNIYISTPYFEHPILDDFYLAKESGVEFFSKSYTEDEKNSYFKTFFETSIHDEIEGVEEQAKWVFEQKYYTHSQAFQKSSSIGMADYSGIPLNDSEIDIIKRFSKVFDQAYTRFLDLKKAEKQAKEAKIETALERVRSRSMAMHNSSELSAVVDTLQKEFANLDFNLTFCIINLINEEDQSNTVWAANPETGKEPESYYMKFEDYPFHHAMWEAWKARKKRFVYVIEGEEKQVYDKYLYTKTEFSRFPEHVKKANTDLERYTTGFTFFKHSGLQTVSETEISHEDLAILERFGRVFEQAYTRFLDLQKAEAQARETQIQLALERVRAKTMAMKTQSDLLGIVELFGQQLSDLDVRFTDVTFIEGAITKNRDWELWSHVPNADNFTHKIHIPYIDTPYFTKTAKAVEEYERTGNPIQTKFFSKEEKDEFLDHYWKYAPAVPEKIKDLVYSNPGSTIVDAFLEEVTVSIVRNDLEPFKDEELSIFERFAKEFKQTYIRFLDIKKAEEQAREAQIEAALERIRSRTMGMQSSEELPEVANLLFKEVQGLDIPAWSCGYNILAEDNKSATCCMSSQGTLQTPFQLRLWGEASFEQMGDFIQSDQNMLVQELGGRALEEHYAYMRSFPDLKPTFDEIERLGLALPTYQINHLCKFNQGFILFITYEKVPHAHDIFKRFTKVFDQTYTRFLDLKKAEAQARESQIEAALERVRSHSMGMQSTADFAEVTTEMFTQLRNFGEDLFATGIVFCDKHDGHVEQWHSIPGGGMLSPMIVPIDLDYIHQYRYDQWKAGKELFSIEIPSDFIQQHFEDIFKLPSAQITLEDLKSRNAPMPEPPPWEIDYGASFKHGYILISSLKHLENTDILPRFAKVFEQAYTRFLDLQTAEKNAYKSKVETALERVRARAMAMQEPHELKEVASVLRTEMGLLGIEELETCSIYILDDDVSNAECWYALKDAKSESKRLISDHISMDFTKTWVGQQMIDFHDTDNETTSIVMKGEQRREWIKYCAEQSKILQSYYGDEIPERTYHLQKFSNGAIGAASAGDISDESWALLKRSASVFSLAYSRFKDLTQAKIDLKRLKTEKKRAEDALSELQTTQKQLIQSEKMASLGELTAGIAHEIQNPLNFVNNFSEVSKELLEEMEEEIKNRDFEEVKAIMKDVIQNLEKINHHGQRADSIVKGMLQHSRSSNEKKEPTDINALADEYMRLAYHGLRAKDKSFNAELVTDFDESIGKINIIPQDIGRVILNLLTNAFYAVNEKKKSPLTPKGGNTYKPTIGLTTKKHKDKVIIEVTDNGNGIPDKVKEKIFQPFFTTKPTGQGTGLGLSMSYDIITKGHNGAFEVESIEGQSTTFRIILPLNKSNS